MLTKDLYHFGTDRLQIKDTYSSLFRTPLSFILLTSFIARPMAWAWTWGAPHIHLDTAGASPPLFIRFWTIVSKHLLTTCFSLWPPAHHFWPLAPHFWPFAHHFCYKLGKSKSLSMRRKGKTSNHSSITLNHSTVTSNHLIITSTVLLLTLNTHLTSLNIS